MKLSKETNAILKNFSGINSNLLIKEGSVLATISSQKNVMASVTVEEFFPSEFGIYDLNEFLGAVSLFEDPDLEFSDSYVTIKENARSIKYYAADKTVLTLPPEKEIKFPEADVITFVLPSSTLNNALKTASVLKSSDVTFKGDGKKLHLLVSDLKNTSANLFDEVIGTTSANFKANLKVDNLRMLPQDYEVTISPKKISRWKAVNGSMLIFVALETTSTFE